MRFCPPWKLRESGWGVYRCLKCGTVNRGEPNRSLHECSDCGHRIFQHVDTGQYLSIGDSRGLLMLMLQLRMEARRWSPPAGRTPRAR